MDTTVKRQTTLVGVVTLIIGLALGLGIGVYGVRSSHASAMKDVTSSTPKIEKKHNKVAGLSTPFRDKDEFSQRVDTWDPFRRMEQMQEEIDRAIRNATEQFSLGPGATAFRPDAGYSSSFDLRDRKDHFELRAYLPDVDASDVNVKIDNGRTLHVSANHKKQESKRNGAGEESVTELGEYEQMVTLPESVRANDMRVQRNGHEVIITIPKANNNTDENKNT